MVQGNFEGDEGTEEVKPRMRVLTVLNLISKSEMRKGRSSQSRGFTSTVLRARVGKAMRPEHGVGGRQMTGGRDCGDKGRKLPQKHLPGSGSTWHAAA